MLYFLFFYDFIILFLIMLFVYSSFYPNVSHLETTTLTPFVRFGRKELN